MAGGEHGTLNDQAIRSRLLHQARTPVGLGRHRGHRNRDAGLLDGRDPFADQVFPNRGLVDLLQQPVDAIARGFGNLAENAGGVEVAGLQPVEVDDGHPAQAAHFNRETDVDDAIHGGRQDRDGEP